MCQTFLFAGVSWPGSEKKHRAQVATHKASDAVPDHLHIGMHDAASRMQHAVSRSALCNLLALAAQ